jgi:hypothetical protein
MRRECNAKANIHSLTLHTPHSTLHTYTRSHSLALSHSLSHVRSQSYTHALSLSHVHSRSIHSLTHSLTHIHSRSKKKKLTHPRTLTLNTHTHTLSLSLTHTHRVLFRRPSSLSVPSFTSALPIVVCLTGHPHSSHLLPLRVLAHTRMCNIPRRVFLLFSQSGILLKIFMYTLPDPPNCVTSV